MGRSGEKWADARLRVTIAAFMLGGPLLSVITFWLMQDAHGRSFLRLLAATILLGPLLFFIGLGELNHRLRHGPQKRGKRVRHVGD